ncbi:MAG: hypothetical protein J0I52_00785 [Bordetella sp.]|nr:hypothetical protein [Bordetella sp.]
MTEKHFFACKLAILAAFLSVPANDARAQAARPVAALERLKECRLIVEADARARCFEAGAASLISTYDNGDLIIIERAQADAARRAMFGFSAPSLPAVFGGDAIDALETSLVRTAGAANGAWIFHLADGSVWRQIDNTRVANPRNRQGEPVIVRKAALGSYFLKIGDSRAIRVRRE